MPSGLVGRVPALVLGLIVSILSPQMIWVRIMAHLFSANGSFIPMPGFLAVAVCCLCLAVTAMGLSLRLWVRSPVVPHTGLDIDALAVSGLGLFAAVSLLVVTLLT
jgi:hypothetical protein